MLCSQQLDGYVYTLLNNVSSITNNSYIPQMEQHSPLQAPAILYSPDGAAYEPKRQMLFCLGNVTYLPHCREKMVTVVQVVTASQVQSIGRPFHPAISSCLQQIKPLSRSTRDTHFQVHGHNYLNLLTTQCGNLAGLGPKWNREQRIGVQCTIQLLTFPPFHFVLFKFKDLVAKQHPTNCSVHNMTMILVMRVHVQKGTIMKNKYAQEIENRKVNQKYRIS